MTRLQIINKRFRYTFYFTEIVGVDLFLKHFGTSERFYMNISEQTRTINAHGSSARDRICAIVRIRVCE